MDNFLGTLHKKFIRILKESSGTTNKVIIKKFFENLDEYNEVHKKNLLVVNCAKKEKSGVLELIKLPISSEYLITINEVNANNIGNVIALIHGGDAKLSAYKFSKLGESEAVKIVRELSGKLNLESTRIKLIPVDETGTKYVNVKAGKSGEDAELKLDIDGINEIISDGSLSRMWHDIRSDDNKSSGLEYIIKNDKNVKKLEAPSLEEGYEIYSTGRRNTKTNLSFKNILNRNFLESFTPYEIADLLIIDTKNKKYLALSNKLDKNEVPIGSIAMGQIRDTFNDTSVQKLTEQIGIEESYMDLLKKLIEVSRPIQIDKKFAYNNANINEQVLKEFLCYLTQNIYRFGYVMVNTDTNGKITSYKAITNEYINSESKITVQSVRFTELSPEKMKKFGCEKPDEGNMIWSLGFNIRFTLDNRNYIWRFRDKHSNGTLNFAGVGKFQRKEAET